MAVAERAAKSVFEKLNKVERMTPNWCIYRVPERLRQVNPDAYTPHLISIGPFHSSKLVSVSQKINITGFGDMEEHKSRYTLSLLRRVRGHDDTSIEPPLNSCMKAIVNAETEIRDRYATSINLNSEELASILLLDSCFILELFFRYSKREVSEKVKNDPVFQSEWMLSALRRDLALLENQIPFFVLKRLFYMVVEHDLELRADYLPRMAYNFFFALSGEQQMIIPLPLAEAEGGHECKHLLDLLLKCYLPWPPRPKPSGSATSIIIPTNLRGVKVPNVKSLNQAGASIKKLDTNNLFDIHFTKGALHLPVLHIHEWTASLFRNLIAYEHCCPNNGGQYIVSYIVLMDRLINDKDDIELLEKHKIITVELGGNEDVTNFFKDICKQVVVKDFYFEYQCKKIEKYYKSFCPKNQQMLRKDYFKNRWATLSILAGLILIACSILQTVLNTIKYFKKKQGQ